MNGKSRKPRTTANQTVAAMAGTDSWKTWAGRHHGTDNFEILDLFRGAKRSLHKRFHARTPPPGSTCPVCYTEPDEWFLTSSCSHAVCYDCIKAYAGSQIRDTEQKGPLKCPVCPQYLRTSDAIAVLGDDNELIRAWDLKIRDQLLRAVPSFRSCPNCTDSSGGGFVTPECLSPHHVKSRQDASFYIHQVIYAVRCLMVVIYAVIVRYIAKNASAMEVVDLFFMLSLVYVIVQLDLQAHRRVAAMARTSFYRPIEVECPCCSIPFILPSETKHLEDEETKIWLDANTRRCPSCSAPITKNGGCNHMRCSHCHASFCWQCMRLRTNCTFNRCQYNTDNPSAQEQQPNNDSILEEIDKLLALEPLSPVGTLFSALFVVVSLFGRNMPILQFVIGRTTSIILSIPFSLLYGTFVFSIPIYRAIQNARAAQIAERGNQNFQANLFRNPNDHMVNDPNLLDVEEDMVAQALRQSLLEQ